MRSRYSERAARLAGSDVYSPANRSYQFAIQRRQRVLVDLLHSERLWPLQDKTILEVGCGNGGVLTEMLELGANPGHLHGADLLVERVASARVRLPHSPLTCASGARLPYPEDTFDIILQFTVFSSILNRTLCYTVARELLRVLRPGGCILWYDFWINPVNKQTRGISPAEIKEYFSSSRIEFKRITLAPPIARRMVPLSWPAAVLLEKMKIFNTHYLAAIRPIS